MRGKIVASFLQFLVSLFCFTELSVGQSTDLNDDSIAQMVSWQISDSEIIAAIGRASKTNFDFSPAKLNVLRAKHVSAAVLKAMFDATVAPSTSGAPANPSPVKPRPAAPDNDSASGTPPQSGSAPETPPEVHFPTSAQSPPDCPNFPAIPFDLSLPADNDRINAGPSTSDLKKMVRLNAADSGGEIYTKSSVYVAYVNRLRYTVSLGGVVSVIAAPTLPFDQMFTTLPLSKPAAPPKGGGGAPNADERKFLEFTACYNHIFHLFTDFQGELAAEELLLNTTKVRIGAATNNLQPIVETADEARSAADLTIFPKREIPPFPGADLAKLRSLVDDFQTQFPDVSTWANAKANANKYSALYQQAADGMAAISTRLDQYLGITGSSSTANASTKKGGAADRAGTNTGDSTTAKNSGNPTKTPAPGNGATESTSEASDYEAARVYVNNWRQIFRTVAGANDDYFVVTFTPACGGFFGNGTSTQMQLSVTDSLNPPTAGAKVTPVNLDSIVCQPALSVSNGLGLSFIPSQTPAFVPAVKKDAQGNPVLDSTGIRSLFKLLVTRISPM